MEMRYFREPTPHAEIPQLLAPGDFAQLRFPYIPQREGGRTGRDLFPGELRHRHLLTEPGWRQLATAFLNEGTLRRILDLFGDDMRRQGCLVDPDKAYLEPYEEPGADILKAVISEDADPNALFFRFDVHEVRGREWGFAHVDWPRRVVGGMLFLSSADEEGMEGGEFGLYVDRDFRDDRVPHDPELRKAVPVVKNTGALFLNSNTGFHGPVPIRALRGVRRWVYFSVSSRRNVWPTAETTPAA